MILIDQVQLEGMLTRAAEMGARQAVMCLVTYNLSDAAKQIGISSKTLSKRIDEKKIKVVDGRITGAELMRYLKENHT